MIPTTFNIFMNVEIAGDGELSILPPKSKAGDAIVLSAEMDLIVGLTACASATVIVLTCLALRPSSVGEERESQGEPQLAPGHLPEQLAKAPASYADVPKLGPPLTEPVLPFAATARSSSLDRATAVNGVDREGEAMARQEQQRAR